VKVTIREEKSKDKNQEKGPVTEGAVEVSSSAPGGTETAYPAEETRQEPASKVEEEAEKEALEQQLAGAQREAAENRDKYLRAVAELENFRRRTAREFAEMSLRAGERILTALLDPADNLARALDAARKMEAERAGEALTSFIGGVEMIYQQLVSILEKEQVTPMETVGTTFDPNLHDALVAVERSDVPPNTVVEEVQRGYRLGDRVLRHAKVVVSKAPVAEEKPNENENTQ